MTTKQTTTAKKKTARRSRVEAGIIRGLEEALGFERGDASVGRIKRVTMRIATAAPAPSFSANDVAQLRQRVGVSQPVFAHALNVNPETVKAWEQGKNTPGGPAARLLELASEHPEWLLKKVRAVAKLKR
jgi:putative transcriptional regulator